MVTSYAYSTIREDMDNLAMLILVSTGLSLNVPVTGISPKVGVTSNVEFPVLSLPFRNNCKFYITTNRSKFIPLLQFL